MRHVVARQQIVDELGATPEVIRRIERLGLIVPLARAASGDAVYYDASAHHTAQRVLTLLDAGYVEHDIALVVARVAIDPALRAARPPRLLTLADLASLVGLAAGDLHAWVDAEALTPWAIDGAGEPLFERDAEPLARALGALTVLGLGALVPRVGPALAAPQSAEAQRLRTELAEHLDQAASAMAALRALARRLAPKRRRRLLRRKKASTLRGTVRST